MGDIRAESRGGMDDVYRENMDLRVSNKTGGRKKGDRLRNIVSWLPLAAGASSRNLGPIF